MFQPKMPGPISPPHPMAPPAGVAGAFHALHSGAMAPKMGHRMAPGPAPHPAGAAMPLMTSGRPVAAMGHMPLFGGMAASANPMPARGSMVPTG